MTAEDRVAALRDLLPGLQDFHYEALAADHPSRSLECHWLNDLRQPIVDVMVRLRFNDAKLLRVKHYCGVDGATLLDQCYKRFRDHMGREEVRDFTVALEVAQQAGDSEAAADVINELNAEQGRSPAMQFDLHTVQTMKAAEAALKRHGMITASTPMKRAITLVRNLTKRALVDTKHRTMDELLGRGQPRSKQPNMLFSDGFFGDGTRLVEVTLPDGSKQLKRTSAIEPLVESFVGMNPMEIQAAIQAKVEAAKAKSRTS